MKKRLLDSIGKEKEKIFRDGIQTPFESDNPIHAAQHATATCCKKCLNYWYDIPINRKLTDEELEYFTKLVYRYLEIKNDEPDEQKDLFNQE
ncbi:MAG: DUF4186 family protein [Ignavibacteria bacterium]|nr:DUF4186 family protein [Ignavibacteria bacterium]